MGETDDFYFDVPRQVHMRRWSDRRLVLTGDAAWPDAALGHRHHAGDHWHSIDLPDDGTP